MDTLGKVHGSLHRSDPPLNQFLPRETPMEMAVQPLPPFRPQAQASEFTRAWPRRAYLLAGTVFLTLAGCYEMYEVLQVGGVTILESIILALFVLLFAWIAFSFMSAIAGFFVLLLRRKDANTAAQQPASQPSTATNTAQSSTNVNASVNINDQQRTRVAESITRLNVQPLTNVNFSLTVGTAVPRDIRLQTLPADVVEVVPQYRGYSFFVVRDEIVIVEPSTYQIVTVLPRNSGATAAAPAPSHSKISFTDKDRDVVRKHVKTRTTERQTTGSTAKVVIRRGERLPDSVEVEEFPETVYREAPSLREYRYIHRENRTYLVDPGERRVIEEID